MGSVFGYRVESELPLKRLRTAEGPRGLITVVRGAADILDTSAEITAIDSLETASGHHVFVIGNSEGIHLIGCSATGGYRADGSALRIEVDPAGTPEMWEHRLLSVVIPIMLADRGDLVLHAAVVEVAGRAVILCGPPMRGKSTLALTFAELGHRVLSEDGAVIERGATGWAVWPAATGARIRTEGGERPSAKVVTGLPGGEAERLAAGAVVLLDPRGGDGVPSVADPSIALLNLVPHLMHAGGPGSVRSVFALLAGLLSDVPVMRASMPDDLARLPEAAERFASLVEPLVVDAGEE